MTLHKEPGHNNWLFPPEFIFGQGPLIPVIVIHDLTHAVPLAKAIMAGGIRVLEVTLRTPVALEAIVLMREAVPDAIIGAGTVLDVSRLKQCEEVGAQFVISPGLTKELLTAGQKSSIALIPGAASVSEVMAGMLLGYHPFKFFPAEAAGGVSFLRSIFGPLPEVRFCATGGVKAENFQDYLALPNVACVGGSWVVPEKLIKGSDWQGVTELCRQVRGILN
ncbi:MAG: keto-deoxy-phosphogluconate aldolase [Legionellales bacterium RIFCSPHIGHO2_12_FULL_42_9]|nr:MAG: keto-deoxy-phosphogluconate aldolase [Legionellales bacterium RIFCSPHIGHO2_12_FULL_42_9]